MNILFFSENKSYKLPSFKKTPELVVYKTNKLEELIYMLETNVFTLVFLDTKKILSKLSSSIKKIGHASPYSKIVLLNFNGDKKSFLSYTLKGIDYILEKNCSDNEILSLIKSPKIKLNFNEAGIPYIYSDDLTNLYNRRLLNYRLNSLVKYNDQTFSVLFIDIDNFKSVNEKHGHLVASKTLKHLGEFLASFGNADTHLFRYGGDEFVFILTRTSSKLALEFAERIRSYTEKKIFNVVCNVACNCEINFTLSIGIASYPKDANNAYDILDMADQAMFMSKHNNKNMIYLAENLNSKKIKN